jgi:hypothetical protein
MVVMWNLYKAKEKTGSIFHEPALLMFLLMDNIGTAIFHDLNFLIASNGVKKIRKAVVKQLGYVRSDLAIIKELSANSSLSLLSRQEYLQLLVINEIYRQQE